MSQLQFHFPRAGNNTPHESLAVLGVCLGMWLAMGFLGIAGIAVGSESLTSHNYNLMVFTCKLFPVAEPVGGNNFINYALDMANRERKRAGEREIAATAGDAPCCFSTSLNINLFYFLLRSQVN